MKLQEYKKMKIKMLISLLFTSLISLNSCFLFDNNMQSLIHINAKGNNGEKLEINEKSNDRCYLKISNSSYQNHYLGKMISLSDKKKYFIPDTLLQINLCKKRNFVNNNYFAVSLGKDYKSLEYLNDGKVFMKNSDSEKEEIMQIDSLLNLKAIEQESSYQIFLKSSVLHSFDFDTLNISPSRTMLCVSSEKYFDTLNIELFNDRIVLQNDSKKPIYFKIHTNVDKKE